MATAVVTGLVSTDQRDHGFIRVKNGVWVKHTMREADYTAKRLMDFIQKEQDVDISKMPLPSHFSKKQRANAVSACRSFLNSREVKQSLLAAILREVFLIGGRAGTYGTFVDPLHTPGTLVPRAKKKL